MKLVLKTVFLIATVIILSSCKNPPQEEGQTTPPEANAELASESTQASTQESKKAEPTCPHAKAADHECPFAKTADSPCPHAGKDPSECTCGKAEGGSAPECPHHKKEDGQECDCGKAGEAKGHECPHHKECAGAAAADAKEKTTCPVSGEVIKDISKASKSEFKGKTYFFCCEKCKEKFDAAPEKFATN